MKEKHLNDSARELLASSTMAAQSGASIVKQLMSYARQQSLVTEPIRVSEWLRSVRGLFQQTVGESITPTNALSGYYASTALFIDANASATKRSRSGERVTAFISPKIGHQAAGAKESFLPTLRRLQQQILGRRQLPQVFQTKLG